MSVQSSMVITQSGSTIDRPLVEKMSTHKAEEPGRVGYIIMHCKWQVKLMVVTLDRWPC